MKKIGVIGSILAEIEGNPYGQLIEHDNNEGTIYMSYSGCGRNMAENLARMGENVVFASATGDDFSGRGSVRELEALGVDAQGVQLLSGENTAASITVRNIVGDLEMSVGNMDVYKMISKDTIDYCEEAFKECDIIGIDGNISEETFNYILEKFKGKPLFLDPANKVCSEYSKGNIGKFEMIKPDRGEAEILLDMTILSEEELIKAGRLFIEKGVKQVYITLGGGGVYYTDGKNMGFVRPVEMANGIVQAILNPKGGGDAFSAAILSGYLQGYDIKTTSEYAMSAAKIALEAKDAVNDQLTMEMIEERYEQNFGKDKN